MKVLDRETDPKNPTYRTLSEQEQQRILINTMLGSLPKWMCPLCRTNCTGSRTTIHPPRQEAAQEGANAKNPRQPLRTRVEKNAPS